MGNGDDIVCVKILVKWLNSLFPKFLGYISLLLLWHTTIFFLSFLSVKQSCPSQRVKESGKRVTSVIVNLK